MQTDRARKNEAPRRLPNTPRELDRSFRLIVFDWDGTAVSSRTSDASRVAGLCDGLLGIGTRIVIVTGTNFGNVANQLGRHLEVEHLRRMYVATNRGSEMYGFDRRGAPALLWRRVATAEEEQRLDQIVDDASERLSRMTGLSFAIVRDRLNRRKIDLIPEPAWRDPPKNEIGSLLAAVEGRLRGAGLRSGLREAFELTERLAREHGLADAKVTSDVKHIELGLTDKGDAMACILRELALPLRIPPGDILLAGDELGPTGGFEGSDHRMLSAPGVAGAVVVSVGPEPGGVPPGVIHLGGGPERFCDLLEHQLAVEARLGPFAPPRDAAWVIEEPGFDVAREHEIESLLAIANGYVGSRGSIAEGTSVSRPATFLAGAFEPSADLSRVPELVIVPEWGRLRFVIEGAPFSVETDGAIHHRRILDLRRGRLLRELTARSPGGHETELRTVHIASLADRHLLLEGVELSPLNYTGTVRIEAILSGDVKSASGAAHWASFQAGQTGEAGIGERGPSLRGTTKGGLVASIVSHLSIRRPEDAIAPRVRRSGPTWASEVCDLGVRLAETSELHRVVTLFTSRDAPDPEGAAAKLLADLAARPAEELFARHEQAWRERWRRADVVIDGAPDIERAVRFALYHLIASANPEDPRCSIGARALSGEAYRGHVFWDTETFMLPFYVHCFPEAARALLGYRYLTLDGARRKAKSKGYEGALFAWESAETGDETAPAVVVTPFGEVLRVMSGEIEHHISADIAYAVCAYGRATGDRAFMEREGLTLLVETARLWASRGHFGDDGLYHLDRILGPDEYHEGVDDNAFTNWLARFNLLAAADAADHAEARAAALGVTGAEIERFREVAQHMYLGQDPSTGLIEQFAGYHALEPIDLSAFGPRHAPVDMLLGRARVEGSQIVKQSDVVQLLALLWDDVAPTARSRNFLYYEPRTAHGSSLSPGTHALVAARLGLASTAARYLERTAAVDLDNNMGNAAGGIHAAALGSLWQAVVFGVGGVRPSPRTEEALLFEPNLLPGWRHLGFPLSWRGALLDVHVEPSGIEVGVAGEQAVVLQVGATDLARHEVRGEPSRRYAARRSAEGYEQWEEIPS